VYRFWAGYVNKQIIDHNANVMQMQVIIDLFLILIVSIILLAFIIDYYYCFWGY
jgi:hypothetical protein